MQNKWNKFGFKMIHKKILNNNITVLNLKIIYKYLDFYIQE